MHLLRIWMHGRWLGRRRKWYIDRSWCESQLDSTGSSEVQVFSDGVPILDSLNTLRFGGRYDAAHQNVVLTRFWKTTDVMLSVPLHKRYASVVISLISQPWPVDTRCVGIVYRWPRSLCKSLSFNGRKQWFAILREPSPSHLPRFGYNKNSHF